MSVSAARNLVRMITPPSQVASALDWRKHTGGAILSLDIHKNSIGLAIAAHPSLQEHATLLSSIPLQNRGKVSEQDKDYLADVIKTNKVCGVVVSWPLQEGTAKMGHAAGRVFHTLEGLVNEEDSESSARIVSLLHLKPLCLWDSEHAENSEPEDIFGRSPAYCRTSSKQEHRASEEQYNQDEKIVATGVLEDFLHAFWPDVVSKQPTMMAVSSDDEQEDEGPKIAMA
ncbi:unnamed protein product [Cylindrotheca closterium]|uniref:Uncharacterized protein n=1 Tax=Cylindrotheca closterium TaxID=2856 RepID=A0AAD2JL64_9STRA|nr:unnamed protein product [Cylindrotheca closterium]